MEKYKKFLVYGGVGLFIYMPFHIFLSQWLSTFTGGLEAWKIGKDVFAAVLCALLVLTVFLKKEYTRLYLIFIGFAVVFLLLHLVLFALTNQPFETGWLATVYNNRPIWFLIIGYSLALLFPSMINTKALIKILVATSVLVCLVGLAQWVLPKDVMTNFGYSIERGVKPNFFIDDKTDFPRIFSTIRDPNSLGAFLLLPMAAVLGALLKFWNTQKRTFLGGILLLQVLILTLTFSRSTWLAALITALVVVGWHFKNLWWAAASKNLVRWSAVGAVILLVSFGAIYGLRDQYFVQNVVFHADESTTLDDPNELRLKLYERGIEGVIEDPEGRGPGTAGLVSTKLPNGLLTENYYLQIAYEVGVFGLFVWLGFLALITWRLWGLRQQFVNRALLASLAGLLLMNMLLHTWANEAVVGTWFMVAGAAMVGPVGAKKIVAKTRRPKLARGKV